MIYTEFVTPNAGVSSLTTFEVNASTNQFKISSQNFNQIGNYTVTFKGAVDGYTSRFASVNFTIEVLDPCLRTVLSANALGD